jgi:Domain of unknown function (DUF4157)
MPSAAARATCCGRDLPSVAVPTLARGRSLQRSGSRDGDYRGGIPAVVGEVLRSPGRPLDATTRTHMGRAFGHDFSAVRVHTDAEATRSARAVDAAAYTVGHHVVWGADRYDPASGGDRLILAHELAHVVQQAAGGMPDTIDPAGPYEDEARQASAAIARGRPPGKVSPVARTGVMRLTGAEFRAQLGATESQKAAITTLFSNAEFLALWRYLENCRATPTQDLGPLRLKVTPGLRMDGVERFGGYFGLTNTLEINPTKPEHQDNPTELVDTITHELIHAINDLEAECVRAGSGPAPLQGAETVGSPTRAAVAGTPREAELMRDLGPGASNPCDEFIDINAAAQHLIVRIMESNIELSGVGRPTVTFVNVLLRKNPAAMTEYTRCQRTACALAGADQKREAVARCGADIIRKYYQPPAKPKVKAPQPARPKFGPLYTPRKDFRDKILQSAEDI